MSRSRVALRALSIVAFSLALAPLAHAQATRTWVSGVGDDVNPCSRTAPCKTFAGAISKTAAGGEIDALDPGGFGAVTITKAITIDGGGGGAGFGGILAAGTTGVTVNLVTPGVADGGTVTLRNLSINGGGTGLNGIRIVSSNGATVVKVNIEHCQIFGFRAGNGRGISDERSNVATTRQLFIKDTIVRGNSGIGIAVAPTAGPFVSGTFDNVQVVANDGGGISINGGHIEINNSNASGNASFGVQANQTGPGTFVVINNSTMNVNGSSGISAVAGGVVISNVTVTDNGGGVNGVAVTSFQNNKILGNGGGDALPAGSAALNQTPK